MSEFHQFTETDYIVAFTGDMTQRLSSGMTLGEAMNRAHNWWDRKGRGIFEDIMRHQIKTTGSSFASSDPLNPNFVSSGILNAVAWNFLTQREKVEIMVKWHNSHVIVPDMTNITKATYEMGKGYVEYDEND